jgi:hypothetical protein
MDRFNAFASHGAARRPGSQAKFSLRNLLRALFILPTTALALPAPALAQAECTVHRGCWDQACEAMDLPMALQPDGEGWQLAWQQGAMFLYQGSPDDPEGTLALYEPYATGNRRMSGLKRLLIRG